MKRVRFVFTKWGLLFGILCLAVPLLNLTLSKKYIGHHDWNSAMYATIARNFFRYGIAGTRGGQAENPDLVKYGEFSYKTHYPPLLPVLISQSYRLFGVSETSARLVPFTASLLLVIAIYILADKLFGRDEAFISSILLASSPLFIYFGTQPVHESVVPAFSLFAVLGYIYFFERPSVVPYFLLVSGVVLGGLTNWTGFYIVPPLVLHYFLFKKRSIHHYLMGILIPLCIGIFILHILHMQWLTGGKIGLGGIFLKRLNPYLSAELTGYSLPRYIWQEITYLRIYLTNIAGIGAGVWLTRLFFKRLTHQVSMADTILFALLIYGSLHLVIFQDLAFIHDYMIYYLMPFVVLAAAFIFTSILHKLPKRFRLIFILVLVGLMTSERASFTKALINSDMNTKGVEIGEFISRHTNTGDTVFITSNSYKEFYEVFINFYAARHVEYGETLPQILVNYRLIVRPKAHDALPIQAKTYLSTHFAKYENSKFIWYDTAKIAYE